jgi:hypothetical protein
MSLVGTMCESSANVYRPTIGRDSQEGVIQDPFVHIAGPFPCSLNEGGATAGVLYGQRNAEIGTTIYFPLDPLAEVNDLIVLVDRSGRSVQYLVQGEAQSSSGREVLWAINVTRVRQPS